jgi:hypothetical protein
VIIDSVLDAEIYDEISQAQVQIFANLTPDKKFLVTTINGQTDYRLTKGGVNILSAIRTFILPSTWNYPLEFVSPNQWNDVVNGGEFDSLSNPVRATIIGINLVLYPAPSTDNETLTVIGSQKLPESNIDKDTDPELSEEWDKALEDYALWRLLGDGSYYQSYNLMLEQHKNLDAYKGYSIQRPRSW